EQFCGYQGYMNYLDLYRRYWTPFRRLPGPLQRVTAQGFAALARLRPSLGVYADIVDRAARDREHFWSGATVFWNTLKRQLLNPDSFPIGSASERMLDC